MPVGRYFRGLTAYDLLGNLVPGVIALVAIMGFIHSPPAPSDIGGYGLFTVFAFSIGALAQEHASEAVGQRKSFDKTMQTVETLPSLQSKTGDSDNGGSDGESEDDEDHFWEDNRTTWAVWHPFIGPLIGWYRPPRGEKLDDAILANRIWEHLVDTHEIPFTTESYGVLYHLMSSRVDDMDSPSRATRIQAIRNFYRGMWISSWYSFILVWIAICADLLFTSGDSIPILDVDYLRPAYFTYWTPVWHLAIVSAIGVVVFWVLFESTEEDYLEYLFVDYAVAIGRGGSNVSFGEGSELTVAGDVTAKLETDVANDGESAPRGDRTAEPDQEDSDTRTG